jgi:hypothetical protein
MKLAIRKHDYVVVGIVVLAVVCGGCVRRRMTVRSNPPGALVYIDDQEIGKTPVSTPFTYYGTRKIRLVRDGYETLTVMQKVSPPWYEIPPLDFITENLYPGELRDERLIEFDLQPQRIVPRSELLDRANELRAASYTEPGASSADAAPGAAESPPSNIQQPDWRIPPPFYPEPTQEETQ